MHWKTVPDPNNIGMKLMFGREERVLSYSYSKNPMLPAEKAGVVNLYIWGNRDQKDSKLPHTGWCRIESLSAGKWNWLHPVPIEIPAIGGVEKGKWMAFSGPLKGILVEDERHSLHAYMLTQAASEDYAQYTKHERMPVIAGIWKPTEPPRPVLESEGSK